MMRDKEVDYEQPSPEFLERINRLTPITLHVFDLKEDICVYANRPLPVTLGYQPHEYQPFDMTAIQQLVHPEDLSRLFDLFGMADHLPDNESLDIEIRLLTATGEWRWFRLNSRVFARTEEGRAHYILSTLEDITIRVAVDNAYEEQIATQSRIAQALQRALLQTTAPLDLPSLDVSFLYEPASDEATVGGDFYDMFTLGNKVALVVGDVEGKGIEAATRTAEVKFALRAYLRLQPDNLAGAVEQLNSFLFESYRGEKRVFPPLVTLTVALFEPICGTLCTCVAGSEPALILRSTGLVTEVKAGGMVLGAEEMTTYECESQTLELDDLLILATDGLTEVRQNGVFFGLQGVARSARAALKGNFSLPPVGRAIYQDATLFGGGAIDDDVSLLLARRR